MKTANRTLVLAIAFGLCGLWAHGALGQAGDGIAAKVGDLFRWKQNLPADVTMTVGEPQPSDIKGMKKGAIHLSRGPSSQDIDYLVSEDNRWVIFNARIEDLNTDIAAEKAKKAAEEEKKAEENLKKLNLKDQPAKGPKNAKVTVVEFSDFQCPYCARAHDTLAAVEKEYGDKIRVIYKNFPLGFHPWAEPSAIAGECVYDQDESAFWAAYDYYFAHQKELTADNVKEKTLEAVAGKKVNADKFKECFDGKKTLDRVKADMEEGKQVGVTGTPAFLVNGRVLSGAQPIEKFRQVIDEELKAGK